MKEVENSHQIEMAKDTVIIQENEYNEILRQAVAVIENSRTILARRMAATASNTYWEIGKLLHEKKLERNHCSGNQII